ncbi:mitochondrial ribosomal protein subunit L20-domain-containing protein [Scheffersomyces amazonensis]|uniref:mitochondrial ribosomal protein subunit L20-domain-containing protein n=1 Tax=Scheffersomyces amazonensis TaxID=1078765 RepID=UPI00315D2C98
MLRNSIRRSSTQSTIPFQPVPLNRFNQDRSAFNFKPPRDKVKNIQGLIHNPPAAIVKPSIKTPFAFLPANDPRRSLSRVEVFTKEELKNYPIITNYRTSEERDYNTTPETVAEIKRLREEDPSKWTISKLSIKFNLSPHRVNVFAGTLPDHLKKDENEGLTPLQVKRKEEKKKRVQLWLRNEF